MAKKLPAIIDNRTYYQANTSRSFLPELSCPLRKTVVLVDCGVVKI
ncbi:MAG: hypothetical protein ACUZ8I_08505 [Candidatus Scalindua sp.]